MREGNEISFGTYQPQTIDDYRYIYRHLATGGPTEGLHAHYELTEELGKGTFATVMKAMNKSNGLWYACKMIHLRSLKGSITTGSLTGDYLGSESPILKEVRILESLQHPNICQLKEVFYEPQYLSKLIASKLR